MTQKIPDGTAKAKIFIWVEFYDGEGEFVANLSTYRMLDNLDAAYYPDSMVAIEIQDAAENTIDSLYGK